KEGNHLYNALSVIHEGQVLATYRKQCLPNYQVFDERRYFWPGSGATVFDLQGVKFGVTICEDMWEETPSLQAAQAGAQILLNINASPFHRNKTEERAALLARRAQQTGMSIVYTNLAGGQDELRFDAGSMAVTLYGECRMSAASFEEGLFRVVYEL